MEPSLRVDSADGDALPVGTVIDGRYTITGVIGSGGMGIVHRARHNKLEMEVAIKTVRRLLMLVPEAAARFVDEAHATALLRGSHIARIFDFGRLRDGRPYLAMELLEGEDLADRLRRSGPLSNEAAQDTLVQICDALIEAHGAGIVHRDLKPENLFYARDGSDAEVLKVLDFGIARSRGRTRALTTVGMGLGSPHYMAPEQMEGTGDTDHRVDLWTLGIVAYEALTGLAPFQGDRISEVCARVLAQKRAPIEELRPDVWPALVSFIDQCLRLRPADRFPDAHSARAALRRAKPLARLPSIMIGPDRDSDPDPDTDPDTDPGTSVVDTPLRIAGLRRRWPKVLAVVALAAALVLAWVKPQGALAVSNRAIAAMSTANPLMTNDEPADQSIERSSRHPSRRCSSAIVPFPRPMRPRTRYPFSRDAPRRETRARNRTRTTPSTPVVR